MQFNIVSPDQFRTVPWKNGKGSTQELMCRGSGVDGFDWRLSMAPVVSDGTFSDFKNYDRTLILLNGNGLTLDHSSGQRDELNRRFDMAHFDGAWKTGANLHDGDILDFNVMTRQNKCRSIVTVLDEHKSHQLLVNGDQLIIYPIESDIDILTPESIDFTLPGNRLFLAENVEVGQWTISGGKVVCIQIHYMV